jgi:hypothetical protein
MALADFTGRMINMTVFPRALLPSFAVRNAFWATRHVDPAAPRSLGVQA